MPYHPLAPAPPRRFFPVVPIIMLGALLCFPSLSIQGASHGLLLWFNVVLPTLAPFIICTQMVVSLGGVPLLMKPLAPLSRAFLGLSGQGAYVFLCGLLCGYPLGAKMCADFKRSGAVTEKEARYLLAICNHPSPMFLLGYVRGQLPIPVPPALLLASLYLPILPLSLLARYLYRPGAPDAKAPSPTHAKPAFSFRPSLEDTIASTCETMVVIGGYIMLFSILAAWIRHLALLPPAFKAFLTGLAEITTGVNSLCAALTPSHALPPTVCAVAFGGFSGAFQTKSVIKGAGLSLCHYIGWKILHACFSGLSFIILAPLLGA